MPKILRAYVWRPTGVVAGCQTVELPGGIVFNPRQRRRRIQNRFNDLACAIAEMVLLAKASRLGDLDGLATERLAGCGKVGRNGVAYGQAVEFNASDRSHRAWGPYGLLPALTDEEPGWLADPAVGALATAGCELMLTLLEILVAEATGSVAFVDTDAAFVRVTHDSREIEINGRGADGAAVPQMAGTLTFETLVGMLDRFRPLAEATKLSIPAHDVVPEHDGYRLPRVDPAGDLRSVFKVTSQNLIDGDRWRPGLRCYAVAQKRYALFREVDGTLTSPKPSAFVMGALANFRPDGELDWDAIEEAWRIGPDLAEGLEPGGSVGIDLHEPVFQPMVMAGLRDWRALGRLCFSTENPEGIRPFEAVLVPVPSGKSRARLVAHYEPDRAKWNNLDLLDPAGRSWSVRTAAELDRAGGGGRGRVQVVPSVREWLAAFFSAPEPMSAGPGGEPCDELTRGVLISYPVRIVALRVAGQETHRRRDEEVVEGWDVQLRQDVFARYCRAPGCRTALMDRQRMWCEKHRKYPGRRRTRWSGGQ